MTDPAGGAVSALADVQLHATGWECAYVLLQEYPERLTVQEHVRCLVAVFSAPERSRNPSELLALYLRVVGVRT